MNFKKHSFTLEEFLALPEFETVREAPVGKPFLLSSKVRGLKREAMAKLAGLNPKFDELPPITEDDYGMHETSRFALQKQYINELLVEHKGEEGIKKQLEDAVKADPRRDASLKVTFWMKYKDGNVQDCGGRIRFLDKLVLEDNKLIISTPSTTVAAQ